MLMLVLLLKHYQDFPFKAQQIQSISGGLIFWLFTVSFTNFLDSLIGLNWYLNIELLKMFQLVMCMKVYK